MKTVAKIGCILFLLAVNKCVAQTKEEPGMYITAAGDTVRGINMTFKDNNRGFITELSYTDTSGKKVEIIGKENMPDIVTVCMAEGYCFDKVSLNPEKEKYFRNVLRSIDGKIIVYYNQGGGSHTNASGGISYDGGYMFVIRMPDGKMYDIDKGNIKSNIIFKL